MPHVRNNGGLTSCVKVKAQEQSKIQGYRLGMRKNKSIFVRDKKTLFTQLRQKRREAKNNPNKLGFKHHRWRRLPTAVQEVITSNWAGECHR